MPIYDRDATNTLHEIKEVRDYENTNTSHIIKEVYDYDGPTKYVVYVAEETVVATASSSTATTLGGNTWQNIPVTGYSSVTVTVVVSGTKDIFWGGIAKSKVTHGTSYGSPSNALHNVKSVNGAVEGDGTKTLTLDPTATYYVYAGVYTNTGSGNNSITVTAVFS